MTTFEEKENSKIEIEMNNEMELLIRDVLNGRFETDINPNKMFKAKMIAEIYNTASTGLFCTPESCIATLTNLKQRLVYRALIGIDSKRFSERLITEVELIIGMVIEYTDEPNIE